MAFWKPVTTHPLPTKLGERISVKLSDGSVLMNCEVQKGSRILQFKVVDCFVLYNSTLKLGILCDEVTHWKEHKTTNT